MPDQTDHILDTEWATRVYIDTVSYSNPLPPWSPPILVAYRDIAESIDHKIQRILSGEEGIGPAFEIAVPYRLNDQRLWHMPPVNDQIILQACTTYLSAHLPASVIDKDRIFTYRKDPGHPDFLNQQLEGWLAFQSETTTRLTTSAYILQLDLRRAFASMRRSAFLAFFRSLAPDRAVVNLLAQLLDGWMQTRSGIPLVNDSLFFLGNAYLSTVDEVIGRYANSFIRFMDDYRLFGDSRSELETLYEEISRDLEPTGFRINEQKVRLGNRAEYFKAMSAIQRTEDARAKDELTADPRESLGPTLFIKVVDPDQLVDFIEIALADPEKMLTVRLGRLLMREIRKLRTNASIGSAIYDSFATHLATNTSLRRTIRELTWRYLQKSGEEWRIVWLFYLMEDLIKVEGTTCPEYGLADSVAGDAGRNPLVQLWARRLLRIDAPQAPSAWLAERRNVSYLEEGKLLYGDIP